MQIIFDLEKSEVVQIENGIEKCRFGMATQDGFSLAAKAWLRCGWDAKYVYTFSWFGRPVIQLPDDMIRIQEVVYSLKPDVIIETGVAHGGSLMFYASLLKAIGKGIIVGVDIEIRKHNRKAIEFHELASYVRLIEGSSIDEKYVAKVKKLVPENATVLVLLDSCHTKSHVLAELNAYSKFVSIGSYIVATDGIMKEIVGAPRTQPDWFTNNPQDAVFEFIRNNPSFILEEPKFSFNEGNVTSRVTYWPNSFVKRIK